MATRQTWMDRIEAAWHKRPVIWLSGVRRVGKTTLARSLSGVEYFDCELPSHARGMQDPEAFLSGLKGKRVVLDEVHRLADPSRLLKIAADHFPTVRVLATGSSTIGASAKFRDTLAGRKLEVWLTPMTQDDLVAFGGRDLRYRLLRGGLPPFFLAEAFPEKEIREWMDAYWAKDILELFRLERKTPFDRLFELLMLQSGGMFEASSLASPCEISRTTVKNYLAVLEATHVVHVVRPFGGSRASEVVAAPKTYGFDTGFVAYFKGWNELRPEDVGLLWEHYVLNEIHAELQTRKVNYWRDKQGHEVDFVLVPRGRRPVAIECKWRSEDFVVNNLRIFHRHHSPSACYVVATDVERAFHRKYGDLSVTFVNLQELVERLRLLPLL